MKALTGLPYVHPLIYLIAQVKRSFERTTLFYDRRSETAKN